MTIIGAVHLIKSLKRKKRRNKRPIRSYVDRKEVLGEVGYGSYQEYLQSEQWTTIRKEKLERFPKCLLCNRKSSQVHHMAYTPDVLLGLCNNLLVALCDECHRSIEFDSEDKKRSLRDANIDLRTRAYKLGLHRWLASVKRAYQKSDRLLNEVEKRRSEANAKKKGNKPKKGSTYTQHLCQECKKNPAKWSRRFCSKCQEKKDKEESRARKEAKRIENARRSNDSSLHKEQSVDSRKGQQVNPPGRPARRGPRLWRR